MYTIEEARLSRPNPTYHIPKGAMREFAREDIIRALENNAQAAHEHNVTVLWRALSLVWQKLTGSAFDRTQSVRTGSPT
jgi:hypothetical protein